MKKHRYDSIVEGVGLDRITANFDEAMIDEAECVNDQGTLGPLFIFTAFVHLFLLCLLIIALFLLLQMTSCIFISLYLNSYHYL